MLVGYFSKLRSKCLTPSNQVKMCQHQSLHLSSYKKLKSPGSCGDSLVKSNLSFEDKENCTPKKSQTKYRRSSLFTPKSLRIRLVFLLFVFKALFNWCFFQHFKTVSRVSKKCCFWSRKGDPCKRGIYFQEILLLENPRMVTKIFDSNKWWKSHLLFLILRISWWVKC